METSCEHLLTQTANPVLSADEPLAKTTQVAFSIGFATILQPFRGDLRLDFVRALAILSGNLELSFTNLRGWCVDCVILEQVGDGRLNLSEV